MCCVSIKKSLISESQALFAFFRGGGIGEEGIFHAITRSSYTQSHPPNRLRDPWHQHVLSLSLSSKTRFGFETMTHDCYTLHKILLLLPRSLSLSYCHVRWTVPKSIHLLNLVDIDPNGPPFYILFFSLVLHFLSFLSISLCLNLSL